MGLILNVFLFLLAYTILGGTGPVPDNGGPFNSISYAASTESGSEERLGKEGAAAVEEGDMARIHYTARLEDGRVWETTRQAVAEDPAREKATGCKEPEAFGPVEILVGKEEVLPGVGDTLMGMAVGGKKTVTISPNKAYGPYRPQHTKTFPTVKELPKMLSIAPKEYVERFKAFPVPGKEIDFNPYLKARILDVKEIGADLELLVPEDGKSFPGEFGTTVVGVSETTVILTLVPEIGAAFPFNDRTGYITETDGKTFTVDFNHPMAGKEMVLDIELVSLTKAATFADLELPWVEDHDKGLAQAREEKKPVVAVLYADWCGWSKRLLNETFTDPRVKVLKDAFVWVRVDTSEQEDLYALYEQDGYPMIVFLDAEGEILKKINGFKDARALVTELNGLS
jgi:FKBP-type peptidyl-prolyl cis-trans isomerase 2